MSCTQVTACKPPALGFLNVSRSRYRESALCVAPVKVFRNRKDSSFYFARIEKVSLRLVVPSRTQQCAPVCSFGGKKKPATENEASPWKSLKKAMGSLKKEQSLEDILRQQMQKKEYYEDGGGGGKSPEDESLSAILEEVLQVVLAVMGIIFLYVYIIAGEEVTVFARDMLKFIFTRQPSNRLSRFFYTWGRFFQHLNRKKTEIDPYWLEEAIINTPTWWDSPTKYRRMVKALMARSSNGYLERSANGF